MSADHDAPPHHTHGHMDITEQVATYEKVFDKGLVRLGSLGVACLVLFLTIAFCTGAGVFPAFVVAGVLGIAGAVFLRKPPTSLETH